ncbi:hypothetical protein P9202_703 [Prochlorococcus marinus str. MIT 9202]|nr:hypothetical protein P9202_703 [Prochlorococcus marinus str. MIT 9202]
MKLTFYKKEALKLKEYFNNFKKKIFFQKFNQYY